MLSSSGSSSPRRVAAHEHRVCRIRSKTLRHVPDDFLYLENVLIEIQQLKLNTSLQILLTLNYKHSLLSITFPCSALHPAYPYHKYEWVIYGNGDRGSTVVKVL